MSKKFTAAQLNYHVSEIETLAVLQALLKWEDKLLGYPINIVTDHKALEFFRNNSKPGPRQSRWKEYMERFQYSITYQEGLENVVADALSRYYL